MLVIVKLFNGYKVVSLGGLFFLQLLERLLMVLQLLLVEVSVPLAGLELIIELTLLLV